MRKFVTSDHHFSHKNIITYCKRPFKSVEHMNQELIRRWNERVAKDDLVIHLGDFAFKNVQHFIDSLNGYIIFIKGSHDRLNKYAVINSATINYGGIDWHISHEPDFRFKYNLCGHIHEKWKVRRRGSKIVINVGVDVWRGYPVSFEEILEVIKTGRGIYQDFIWREQ